MSQLLKPFLSHQSSKRSTNDDVVLNFYQTYLPGMYHFVGFSAFVFLWLFFSSCEKSFDWQYKENDIKILAVEGVITNQNKIQTVALSWVHSDPNQAPIPITNATVGVKMAGNTYPFYPDSLNPGNYKSQQAFIGVVDAPIVLEVVVDGILYTGSDMMIPVSSTQRANFNQISTTDTLYQIVSPSSTFYCSEQAMWVLDIDWSTLPAYQNTPADSCKARLFYYDLNTIDVSEVFAPGKQNLKFPKGASVIQTKYSLSTNHAEFRRSLLLETEWRGGLFDVSPGTVYSNINGGAVGFFGASSVVRDVYFVN